MIKRNSAKKGIRAATWGLWKMIFWHVQTRAKLPFETHCVCGPDGWPLQRMPERCVYGSSFSADHAVICKFGGYQYATTRHIAVRGVTAALMSDVCKNVQLCCHRAPAPGAHRRVSSLCIQTAEWGSAGRASKRILELRYWCIFWCTGVLSPSRQLPQFLPPQSLPKVREWEENTILTDEYSMWSMAASPHLSLRQHAGDMGREATATYKRLALLIAEKHDEPYSTVIGWIRCRLSFSLLRSSLLCVRGSRRRSRDSNGLDTGLISVAVAESGLNWIWFMCTKSLSCSSSFSTVNFLFLPHTYKFKIVFFCFGLSHYRWRWGSLYFFCQDNHAIKLFSFSPSAKTGTGRKIVTLQYPFFPILRADRQSYCRCHNFSIFKTRADESLQFTFLLLANLMEIF